jgi:hypothetical protein
MYALKSVGSTGPRRLLAASHSRDSSSCWLSPITCKSLPLCDALDHVAEPEPGERLGAMRVDHDQDPGLCGYRLEYRGSGSATMRGACQATSLQ